MKGYPKWFLPGLIVIMTALLATGLLLTPTTLVMRLEIDLPWRLPGDYRILCASLHATGGFTILMFLGSLWNMHMRSGWRRNKQRMSGLFVSCLMLALSASAIPIYYASEEAIGNAASFVHLIAGAALTLSFGWHWWHGRQKRLSSQATFGFNDSSAKIPAQ